MAIVDLRYARALDEVVLAQNLPRAEVRAQLSDFMTTLQGSAPLREVLENPSIPEEQKLRVLDSMAGRIGMNGIVRNFIAVLIHNLRIPELKDIVQAYLLLADKDGGVADAEVTSARPLDEVGKRALEAGIAKLSGSSVIHATYREDPSLLGGAVVRVGSTVYDGSVRGQLEQMKQRMVDAAI